MSKEVQHWDFINKALNKRRQDNQLRTLSPLKPLEDGVEIQREGTRLINFCSNDYLGLSRHPKLKERSQEYAQNYGVGSTASRLVSGTFDIHSKLEQKLAETFKSEATLIFNSGFQANSTILQALTDRNSLILADKKSHNSLLQGSLLSRATFQRFDHNDTTHLESLLEKASQESYNHILIVTETVFSMDGDRSDLEEITELADRYSAMLFVDDAHAVGVWGHNGLGLAFNMPRIDITLGTFGKAFGAFGAFITCSHDIKEYLINFCPGFIYTTALPPPVIGALDAAVDLIPQMNSERSRYHRAIKRLKEHIKQHGYDTGLSTTQIIPIIIGDEEETLALSDFMKKQGILATAIRPPTVPEASSRIRITLSSNHTQEHIDRLIQTLRRWNEN
ncbi:8-amino-7-oxononanoate synthase [Aliifodinibius sp. S!AR15-10]|uniref:8-amino-7-oxononanoate synthase n=1 Tax=Aliifodinibius sp. S!AR15-10 TaxID=2950437 RepID=UPI002859AABA|nr:8-amino-7-oxononanoate synthase [Aliifodinibius sp. S!AR15-10]MDR8392328.1 8-amino-7-oxononanoate synthase [Aliifodinibius sp. S!AR15-10]